MHKSTIGIAKWAITDVDAKKEDERENGGKTS